MGGAGRPIGMLRARGKLVLRDGLFEARFSAISKRVASLGCNDGRVLLTNLEPGF